MAPRWLAPVQLPESYSPGTSDSCSFQVHYTFNKVLMLQEPLLVVAAFYILFFTVIIYVRLDFSITKVLATRPPYSVCPLRPLSWFYQPDLSILGARHCHLRASWQSGPLLIPSQMLRSPGHPGKSLFPACPSSGD